MAIYDQFGTGYPMYAPSYPMWQPPQQAYNGIQGVRFVNGIEEARSSSIPFGTRAILMDRNTDRFYLKETDGSGASTVTEYRFEKVEPAQPEEYVTRREFDELKERYESAIGRRPEPKREPEAGQQPALWKSGSDAPTARLYPIDHS